MTPPGLLAGPSTFRKRKLEARPLTQGLFSAQPAHKSRPKVLTPEELGQVRDRVAWTPDEDRLLLKGVADFGANWQLVHSLLQNSAKVRGAQRQHRD